MRKKGGKKKTNWRSFLVSKIFFSFHAPTNANASNKVVPPVSLQLLYEHQFSIEKENLLKSEPEISFFSDVK